MLRTLLVPLLICAVIFAVQMMLANKKGTETTIEADLANVRPPAWHFIALEYCYGMLNRTHVVFVTDKILCAARVRGPLPAPITIDERWSNPYFFPRPELVKRCVQVDVTSREFKQLSTANFQIPLAEIANVRFNAKPKWGMGPVPYSGRIHLRLRNGTERELILLGVQDGPELVSRLQASVSKVPALRLIT